MTPGWPSSECSTASVQEEQVMPPICRYKAINQKQILGTGVRGKGFEIDWPHTAISSPLYRAAKPRINQSDYLGDHHGEWMTYADFEWQSLHSIEEKHKKCSWTPNLFYYTAMYNCQSRFHLSYFQLHSNACRWATMCWSSPWGLGAKVGVTEPPGSNLGPCIFPPAKLALKAEVNDNIVQLAILHEFYDTRDNNNFRQLLDTLSFKTYQR